MREKLESEWSPELISGHLQIAEGRKVVSPEAIYQYIYGEARQLIPLLTRGHRRRRSRVMIGNPGSRGSPIGLE